MAYEMIEVSTHAGKVGAATFNRPKHLKALNDALMNELGQALLAFEGDDAIGCMVLTGNGKAFAAGADIGAMATLSYADAYKGDVNTRNLETIRTLRKPLIAAGN